MSFNADAQQVMVFDITSLRFAKRGPFLVISTAGGQPLHMQQSSEGLSDEAQFYEALEAALHNTAQGDSLPIGFYDPFIQLMQCKQGSYRGRLDLDPEGTACDLSEMSGPLDPYEVAALLSQADF